MNRRRWLLGLQASEDDDGDEDEDEDEDDGDEDEDVKGSNVDKRMSPIPESLLREDDISYEIIKSIVEKSVHSSKSRYHINEDEMQLVQTPKDVRGVLRLVKDMTSQGLAHFTEALIGSADFAKTRWKMTQTIKQLLSSSMRKCSKIKLSENQSAVLNNPHNYRWSSGSRFIPADSSSYRAAVYKTLGVLKDLPTQTLLAMHRKLNGVKDYTPRLIPPKKSGWGRDALINHISKKALKLVSKQKEDEPLREPLAKAMDIAGLSLKMIQGCEFATNFVIQPSSHTNALQNEISKCIKLLDERVELHVLKDIQHALNAANENIADRSLKVLIRNLLIEYLCECSDMEIIPECLRQVLAIIKRSCKDHVPQDTDKTKVDEDIESVLSVSACMKQLVWDLTPPEEEKKLDREFADAYMEDLEDSYDDDDDDDDDEEEDNEDEGNILIASAGNKKVDLSQRMQLMRHHLVSVKMPQQQERRHVTFDGQKSVCKNSKYLTVQAATDEASVVAYRLIEHMLNDSEQIQEPKRLDESSVGIEEGRCKKKKRKATHEEDEEEEEEEDDGSGSLDLFKAVEELLPSIAKKCEGLQKLK
ncbi:uncharacterized protein LOC143546007 [Bidens hawaiensis]|uniref:uncharacterized protein LOC143546007 n=1 Tax=Bidens hawaiensis TaxID=980011 RepID=UPI00404A67D8